MKPVAYILLGAALSFAENPSADRIDVNPPSIVASAMGSPQSGVCVRTTAADFLSARLARWQKHLNLEEWKISIVMTPRAGLKPGTLAQIKWDKASKTAIMSVLDPAEYSLPVDDMLKDLEFTVVHELIHLELSELPRNEASRKTEERAVNNLAKALLASAGRP